MEDELKRKALAYFEDGEFEEALNAANQSPAYSKTELEEFRSLCGARITEQYKFLIKDCILQGNYEEALNLKQKYTNNYGVCDDILLIEIPIAKSNAEPICQTTDTKSTKGNECDAKKDAELNWDAKNSESDNGGDSGKVVLVCLLIIGFIVIFAIVLANINKKSSSNYYKPSTPSYSSGSNYNSTNRNYNYSNSNSGSYDSSDDIDYFDDPGENHTEYVRSEDYNYDEGDGGGSSYGY